MVSRALVSRRAFLAGTAGLAVLGACGARGTTLERMRANGVARVGISGERPYGYPGSDGSVTGEAPTVARTVLAGMGVDGLEAVQVPFGTLLDGLLAGQFDLVAAGTTITPGRCARVAFSRPDFVAPVAFLVPAGNPRGIRTFDGVRRAGVPLGVLAGAAEQEYAQAAGITDVRTYDGQSTLFRAVRDGDVPVAALTRISLLDELARNPGTPLQVTPGIPVRENPDGTQVYPVGAFAFRPGNTDLLAAFDAGLTDLHTSGRWLDLVRPFGFGPDTAPPNALTTADACAGRGLPASDRP
ncbi:ectoine/hydroxyectoine ABC transporter substrate-binding protein EhuB [Pseudonocardia ailaonensis]|uniref:Ectoine/hydroxyectoine ABC transporter substrate-binding protein EhuB n=1 Tax=Pseudonocardia ailaonensis TaxID=367279 RepID=A0ABN2NM60_9PSEU